MDLLDLVLARLPLDAFLRTGRDPTIRIRDVNRLDREISYYNLICTLQGELSLTIEPLIPTTLLLSRAAFLRDARAYEYFMTTSKFDPSPDLDLALISGVPEIQAWALAYGKTAPNDPDLITWTPGLIRHYDSDNNSSFFMRGYLHLETQSKNAVSYLSGFIAREMIGRDPFQSIEVIDRLVTRLSALVDPDYGNICLKAGYFAPLIDQLISDARKLFNFSIDYIQPRLLERLPVQTDIDPSDLSLPLSLFIYHSTVECAKEMLPLIERLYPGAVHYIMQLRVICGMQVDEVALRNAKYQVDILNLMITVAHPQMQSGRNLSGNLYVSNHVFYDLNRYAAELPAEDDGMSEKMHILYASGKMFRSPMDRVMLGTIVGREVPTTDRAEIQKRFKQILATLRLELENGSA